MSPDPERICHAQVLGSNPSIGEHRKTSQTDETQWSNQSRDAKEIKFRRIGYLPLVIFLARLAPAASSQPSRIIFPNASRISEASA